MNNYNAIGQKPSRQSGLRPTRRNKLVQRRLEKLPQLATLALLAACVGQASAGRGPAQADLEVQISAPATSAINLPATYAVTVTNLGRSRSGNIAANVSFPLSNTSPQTFVLGAVSALDSRCSISGNILNCNLSRLRKGWSTTFTFDYAAPVSSKPLLLTASASSSTQDPVPGNNTDSVLPNLVYPARPITSAAINVRACTGTALSAFAECEPYPSSIIGFAALLQANQNIDLGQAGYSGQWSQNAAKTSLKMEFFETQGQVQVKVMEFNGWAINGGNCFHGLSTSPQNTNYISPYEVCM